MPTTFLQISNVIAKPFSPKSPSDFSKTPTHYRQKSPNTFSPKSLNTFSPKAPNMFPPTHQRISPHILSKNRRTLYSNSPSCFANYRVAYVLLRSLKRQPSPRSLPTRATGSGLCIMGGQLWFLGHACSSYTCMGSALDVMDYGLAEAMGVSSELTARTLLILRINTLWSNL
jgi:hypothetical protein